MSIVPRLRWLLVTLTASAVAAAARFTMILDLRVIREHAGQGTTAALNQLQQIGIVVQIVDVLLGLYLLGAAVVIARAAYGRRPGAPRNGQQVPTSPLMLYSMFTGYTTWLIVILWLYLLAGSTLRMAGQTTGDLRDLVYILAAIVLAGCALALPVAGNGIGPRVGSSRSHRPDRAADVVAARGLT